MGMLLTGGTGFQLSSLLESGTSVLTWFITSMGSILSFLTSNTALLIWLFVALIGAAFVFIKKLL